MKTLAYATDAEATDFQTEFARLDAARYAGGERPRHLLVIYRRLVAELPTFTVLLREETPPGQRPALLQPWLEGWVDGTAPLAPLFDVQLYLDARGVPADLLRASYRQPLTLRSPDELGILRAAPTEAIRQWYDLLALANDRLGDNQLRRGFRLLLESFFNAGDTTPSPTEMFLFLDNILPLLADRFPGNDDNDRYADWCKLWLHHHRRSVPNIPQDHAYYTLDFPTILRYVPDVIWWNNGLPYRDGEKAFFYYSEEFFWLATGGSLRKIPDHPPYSKRMAKEFLALDPVLPHGEGDTYLYCFFLSLACSPELARALLRFFQRPAALSAIPAWLERLNPIVQTLQTYDFDWQDVPAEYLLGYVYHLFRDQPDFSISGRDQELLLRDATAYYDRIEARRAEQERLAAERALAREARERETQSWPPLEDVSPWAENFGRYDSVRKRQIVELTNRRAIENESATMKHCVSTYFQQCKGGHASIWSLRELRQNGRWYSLLTIQVQPYSRCIVQIRGRFNALPDPRHLDIVTRWAEREGLRVAQRY